MLKSFQYAIDGIKDAFKSEPNLRFHFLASFILLPLAFYLKFSSIEFTILIMTIAFVITLELINTIVEKLVDLHSKERSEEARIIKDMSAGVVLVGAISAAIIGFILFLPKIF